MGHKTIGRGAALASVVLLATIACSSSSSSSSGSGFGTASGGPVQAGHLGNAADGSAALVEATYGNTDVLAGSIVRASLNAQLSLHYFEIDAEDTSGIPDGSYASGPRVSLSFPPSVGTYPCGHVANTAQMSYEPDGDHEFDTMVTADSAGCTVVITRFDAVGGWVDGTFSGSLQPNKATRATGAADVPAIGGSFHVTRQPDLTE